MITKREYADILRTDTNKELNAKLVTDKVNELGLTLTTDLNLLTTEYKSKLFTKVLAVDKGLTMRFNLLRTDESKLKMINDTISLDGYDELDELETIVKVYVNCFAKHNGFEPFSNHNITPESFLTEYNGSIEKAFKGKVIDVTDTELYKELKAVVDTLNDLYKRGVIDEYAFSNGFFRSLERFIPANNYHKEVKINEESIYYYLKSHDKL